MTDNNHVSNFNAIKKTISNKNNEVMDKSHFVQKTSNAVEQCMEIGDNDTTDDLIDRLVKNIPHSPGNHELIERAASLASIGSKDSFILTTGLAASTYAKKNKRQVYDDLVIEDKSRWLTCCCTRPRSNTC